MKKIVQFLLWIITSLVLIILLLYKFNPNIQEIINAELMNTEEVTSFELVWDEIYMNWLINSQTYKQFVKIIEENPYVKTIVQLEMEGSIDDDAMIKLAYYVREKGLNTKLLYFSDINSGAVDLFLAWVERTMEKGAHIWVHSWSNGFRQAKDFPKDAEEHEQNRKYIEKMLWKDDFYWFTIYAAPANGIYWMSEVEIEKYWLLTKPIIQKSAKETKNISWIINNNFGKYLIWNYHSDTIIINSQGGPVLEFTVDEILEFLVQETEIDLNKTAIINIHQEQTLKPWKFENEEISFEEAKKYDEKSVKRLSETIKYFKNKGKKVYVIWTSFWAFVVQDSLAEYGNIADKYLIIVWRLNMPKNIWWVFAKGNFVGFEYDKKWDYKIINFSANEAGMGGNTPLVDSNMAKLAGGLWYKDYISLFKNLDLSNLTYIYGKKDKQVWKLSNKEIEFLKSKNAKVLSGKWGHWETVLELTREGVDNLFGIKK